MNNASLTQYSSFAPAFLSSLSQTVPVTSFYKPLPELILPILVDPSTTHAQTFYNLNRIKSEAS
jgi:hypothetical protein